MAVTHSTVATLPDEAGKEVNKNEWNDDHVVGDGSFVAAKLSATATDVLFGRSTAGAGNGEEVVCTGAGRAILDDATAADQRTTLGLGTIATQASSNVSITGGAVSDVDLNLKDETVAAEGDLAYNATTEELNYGNGQRALADEVGWTPYAATLGWKNNDAFGASINLAASGGTVAIPIYVAGHMLFETLTIRNNDTANARAAEWQLYRQRLNNGNSGENAVDAVTGASGTFSFTPTVASNRDSSVGSPPIYLSPGCYWLAIRNTDGTQTFSVGIVTGGAMGLAMNQTKTLGSSLGSTLDMVAATWTKSANFVPCPVLRGRVFGETTVF